MAAPCAAFAECAPGVRAGAARLSGVPTQTLQLLSGKEHEVITAFAMTQSPACEQWAVRSVHTRVRFLELTRERIERYVLSGEPLDKAGSYAIQGLGGALIERIDGSYSNVVGLPIVEVLECLARMGGPQL